MQDAKNETGLSVALSWEKDNTRHRTWASDVPGYKVWIECSGSGFVHYCGYVLRDGEASPIIVLNGNHPFRRLGEAKAGICLRLAKMMTSHEFASLARAKRETK